MGLPVRAKLNLLKRLPWHSVGKFLSLIVMKDLILWPWEESLLDLLNVVLGDALISSTDFWKNNFRLYHNKFKSSNKLSKLDKKIFIY